jgi:hypothetical protein
VLYLNPGIVFNGTATIGAQKQTGFGLGGELSLVYLGSRNPGLFGGVVVDGLYQFGARRGRMMFGPVIGISYFGVDGGYLLEIADKGSASNGVALFHGGAARLFVTIGVMTLYARYNVLRETADSVEFGAILKMPLPIWGK